MKVSGGKANPQLVNEILKKKLKYNGFKSSVNDQN